MLNLPFLLKFFLVRSQLLCGTLGGFSSSMFADFCSLYGVNFVQEARRLFLPVPPVRDTAGVEQGPAGACCSSCPR